MSVITQAKTVNSIPNTKLNIQPYNQTLKTHGIIFCALGTDRLTGNEALFGNMAQSFGASFLRRP